MPRTEDEVKEFNKYIEQFVKTGGGQSQQDSLVTTKEGVDISKKRADEEGIDYITQDDPFTISDSIAAQKKSFNQFTQRRKMVGHMNRQMATTDAPSYLPYDLGVGQTKFDYDRKFQQNYLTTDQAFNIGNVRAERQGNARKWGNGILKLVAKTTTQFIGGTVGAVYGLGTGLVNGLASGEWDRFYNNSLAHALDDVDEWMDGALPNYYADYEQDAKFWQKLGTANFWSDQVFNGMSFLAGAVLTEVAWTMATAASGGALAPAQAAATTRLMQRGARIMKGLDRAADAKKIKKAVQKYQNSKRKWATLTTVRQMYTGASYEAGVEARHHYNAVKEDLTKRWKAVNEREGKGDLTEEDLYEIEKIARGSSNAVFGINLPLVGASNILMLPKLYGPGMNIQKGLMKQMQKIMPGFMSPVTMTGSGAAKTAQAAHKGNRLIQAITGSQKWAERTNKMMSRGRALVGVPFYEGFIEEGGQKVADNMMYNYSLAKYDAPGSKNTGDLLRAFRIAFGQTYGTDEGMTEVMTGFILGMTGLPGYGGNVVAAQERLRNISRKEGIENNIAEFYNNNKDLVASIKAHHNFMSETHVLNNLMDAALADNNLAGFKDLEHDQFYSYVKAKIITGQFEDIKEDAESIRKMSNEDFLEFFGYSKENFKDENAITKHKNDVVDSVVKRSQKIQEAYKKVDALAEWGQDPVSDDHNNEIRDQMVHALSVMENIDEREKALTYYLADLTNGKVKERQRGQKEERGAARTITYTDKDGNKKKFEIGNFTQDSEKYYYEKLKRALEEDAKNPEGKKRFTEKERIQAQETLDMLKARINQDAGDVNLTDLSPEEQQILATIVPQIEDWIEEGGSDYTFKLQDVIQTLKDLRHLRGRRQVFIARFNALAYDKKARKQAVQDIESHADAANRAEHMEGILNPSAKKLFAKHGTKAKFRVTSKDGDTITTTFYRFTTTGDVVVDGTTEVINPEVLEGLEENDIFTDAQEDAKKALKAIRELKEDRGKKIETLRKEIADAEMLLAKLSAKIVKNEATKTGEVVEVIEEIRKRIEKGANYIVEKQAEITALQEQQQYLDTMVREFFDEETGKLMPLEEVDKYLKQAKKRVSNELGVSEELTDGGLEAKVQEIMAPVIEWVQDNIESLNLVESKLSELREHQNILEKVLFDKLRSRKNNPLIGSQANNFDELYREIKASLEGRIKTLEHDKQKKIPLDPEDRTHNKLIVDLPALKKELATLLNDDRLSTYEGYKKFILANPEFFKNLHSKGLHKLDLIEKELQSKKFNKEELVATKEQVKEFEEIYNSLVSAKEDSDVDNQMSLASDLLLIAKLQESYDLLINKLAPMEQALETVSETSDSAVEEENEVNSSDQPVVTPMSKKDISKQNNNQSVEDLTKGDISGVGYMKTAGDWRVALKNLEKFAKKTKDGGIDYDENGNMQMADNLTLSEQSYFKNAKRHLTHFHYFSQLRLQEPAFDPSHMFKDFVLMPATTSAELISILGIKPEDSQRILDMENFFYNPSVEGNWSNEGDVSDPLEQDIKLVLFKKNEDGTTTPVEHLGEPIILSMMSGTNPNKDINLYQLEINARFTNKAKLTKSGVDAIVNKYNGLRASILQGDRTPLKMTGLTRGEWQEGSLLSPVSGRAFPETKNLSEADLMIATTKDGSGMAEIVMNDGSIMRVSAGFTFLNLGNTVAPLQPRNLQTSEADTVIKLLRKFETNVHTLINEGGIGAKAAYKQADTEGMVNRSIKETIESLVLFGNITKKISPDSLFHKTSANGGGYYFGSKEDTGKPYFISNADLRGNIEDGSEGSDGIGALREFLMSRFHNVENKRLRNKESKYLFPVLDDSLQVVKEEEYTNYEEYLLQEREAEESQPPLLTTMPLISNNILAPNYRYIYPTFSTTSSHTLTPKEEVQQSAAPQPVVLSEEAKKRNSAIQSLKEDLKNAKTKTAKDKIQRAIDSLQNRSNSLGERFSKPVNDDEVDNIIDENQSEGGDANMLRSQALVPDYQDETRSIDILTAEIEKAQKMLPKNEIKIVAGFIKGNAPEIVGQVRGFGKTLVSSLGPGGVVYHETFHQVSLYILSSPIQQRMYDEVRSYKGKVRTYKGDIKRFADLTDKEAEEYLAEEFRQWVMSDGDYKSDIYSPKKSFFGRIFHKIRTILRSLLGLDTKLELDPNMASIPQIFQAIESGKFANHEANLNKDIDVVANMALLPDAGAKFSMDMTDVVTNYFSHALFDKSESPMSIYDIELLSNPNKRKEFTSKINEAYDFVFKQIKNDLSTKLIQARENQNEGAIQDIANTLKYIKQNEDGIKTVHRLWLNTIGLDFSLEYDTLADESGRNKKMLEMFNANQFSAVTSARPLVKILVGTLPNVGTINSVSLTPAVDYRFAMNYLHKNLAGIKDQNAQIAKLQDLSVKQPWISVLLERLGDVNNVNVPASHKRLQTLFWQQFSQSKNDFHTHLIDENGNYYPVDANKKQTYDIIKSEWKTNLLAGQKTGLIKIVDGNFVIDINQPLEFIHTKKGKKSTKSYSIQDFKDNKVPLALELSTQLLEHIGINFTDLDAMLRSEIKIDGETIPQIIHGVARWFVNGIEKDSLADIFDENTLDIGGRLSKLISAELQFNEKAIELRHIGADGKPRHGISLPTHIDNIVDEINTKGLPAHLNPLNNPYTANSIIVKRILEGKPIQLKSIILEGSGSARAGIQGQLTSDLSPSARMGLYINGVLRGQHQIFRTGDSKQDRGLDFGKDFVFKQFEDARDILLGYIEDEINVTRARILQDYGSDIANFQDNSKQLRVFQNILEKGSSEFKIDLKNVLDGTISTEAFWVKNEDTVISLLRDYFIDQAKENFDLFVKHKLIEKSNNLYFNNNISKDIIKNIVNRDDYRELTQHDLDKLTFIFTINDFIGSIEQSKLIFGDFAMYNKLDFFKRTKLATGAKRMALVNPSMNEWLNEESRRRLDGKIADGTANVAVMEEPVSSSFYLQEYIDNGVESAEDYAAMKEADGHAFANMHFYKELLERTGDWTTEQEAVYQAMYDPNREVGQPLTLEDYRAAFPTLKPQYFGPQLVGDKPSLPFSLKFSLSPVFPTLVEVGDTQNQMSLLKERMERKTDPIDMVLFPSAAKIGHKVDASGKAPQLYDINTGLINNNIPQGAYNTMYLEHFGIQLDISPHTKEKVSKGTQPLILTLSDLFSNGAAINTGSQQLAEEYIELLNGLTNVSFDSLLKRMGITKTKTGKYKISNRSKLIQVIQEESAKRKYPENIAEGINRLLSKDSENQKLDLLVNKRDIERLLFSLVENGVIKKKFHGDLRVQQSALGHELTPRAIRQRENGDVILETGKILEGLPLLKFYRKSDPTDPTSTTLGMQVLMSPYFKEYISPGEKLVVKEDGLYVQKQLVQEDITLFQETKIGERDLLDLIGFRIPTDGLHSIDFIEVAGFLPREAGPVVVEPAESTIKVGLDFDIDKRNMYFPSYRRKVDGTLVRRKFIEGDTNTEQGLKIFYDNMYAPTKEYYKQIDRLLAETRDSDPSVSDIDMMQEVGKQLISTWKELAILFDNTDFSDREIDTLIRTFSLSNESAYLEQKNFAIQKYEELKDRIAEIPTFSEFVKENMGRPAVELNHPGAIQNRIMEVQKEILARSQSYVKLLSPTNTRKAKDIALKIRSLKNEVENPDIGWNEIISFKNKQEVASRMWSGIDNLGITAVNNTHLVKSQIGGLNLPINKEFDYDGQTYKTALYAEGFKNVPALSFSNILDIEGGNIKDTFSQILNASADVSKDPFLFDLNITPETGNVSMLLLRAGVPLEWTASFLNQPIIKRYLELKSINDNVALRETGRGTGLNVIANQIRKEFKYPKWSKYTSTYFSTDQLQSMIGMNSSVIQNDKTYSEYQIQILRDFITYDALGQKLSELTNSMSFDTKAPQNRTHAKLMIERLNNIINNSPFENVNNIIENTYLKSLKNVVEESTKMFSDLFEVDKVLDNLGVFSLIEKLNLPDKKMLKLLEKVENDILVASLTKVEGLELRIQDLFFGDNSLPKQIKEMQLDPNWQDNKFIMDLLPIIRTDTVNETDNLKYFSMIKSTFDKNVIRDSFFNLPVNMQNDLVDFAILQSGLTFTDTALLHLIPNELYIDKAIKILPLLRDAQKNIPTVLDNFGQTFFRNSWNDRDIVPRLSSGRFNLLRKGVLGRRDKYQKYDYIAVNLPAKKDPVLYRKAFVQGKDKALYLPVTKLGNGKFLKEYIESSIDPRSEDGFMSILPKNNLASRKEGVSPTNREASDINLKENVKGKYETKEEMDRIKQEDKDNSKDCN